MEKLATLQDKELVTLLKEGSREALEQLYLRYRNKLINLCKLYLKSITDAEDIVQDIFLQLWDTRDSLNPALSFSGYVHTLMRNRILDKYRNFDVHARYAQHILINAEDSTNETDDTIINNDYAALLSEMIETLPPQQKKIFQLSRIEGLSNKEIAELMEISTDNVRNNLFLALKKIKKMLSQHTDIHIQTIIGFLLFFF